MANFCDLIGKTPLVKLPTGTDNDAVKLYGKCEGNNPGSSVKDRAALQMILDAEEKGLLKPGYKIVEATSGNTGIALAMIAAARNYKIELVMPANSTEERIATMTSLGAKVYLTPADKSMEGAIDFANAKAAEGGYFQPNQFANDSNWNAHYIGTGPEIWKDTNGQVTHFVSAMGTTGTIMGVSRFLKELNPDIQIVGVQPTDGSKIPGIRRWPEAYMPKIFERERVDQIVDVSQEDAEECCRKLATESGVFVGVSSAGAVLAAQRICKTLDRGVVVTVLCDRGDRYLSSPLFRGLGQVERVDC